MRNDFDNFFILFIISNRVKVNLKHLEKHLTYQCIKIKVTWKIYKVKIDAQIFIEVHLLPSTCFFKRNLKPRSNEKKYVYVSNKKAQIKNKVILKIIL